MTLPAIVSILDPAFKDQVWTQTDKRNFALVVQGGQVVVGPPIGDLPERRFRDTPTAEGINGILAVLREIHDVFAGTTPITSADIEEFFRLPRYTTAQLTNALATSQGEGAAAYNTTTNRIVTSNGATWDSYATVGDVPAAVISVFAEGGGIDEDDIDTLIFDEDDFDVTPGDPGQVVIAVGQLALGNLPNGSARSVLGRSANSSGLHASIAGNGTALVPTVLSDEGGSLAFRSLSTLGDALGTLLEEDLSALATNAFTDGSEAMGAIGNVTVANTVNAGANWGLVNGTGLRLSCSGTNRLMDTTATTAAHFYFPLSQLAGFRGGRPIFIDIVIAASSFPAGNDRIQIGLWGPANSPVTGAAERFRYCNRGNNGGTDTIGVGADATRTFYGTTTQPSALSVRIDPNGPVMVGFGTYSGAWPQFNYVTANNTFATSGSNQFADLAMRIFVAVCSGAGGTHTMDVSRWRFRQ